MSDRRRAKELKRKRRQQERHGRSLHLPRVADEAAFEDFMDAEFRDPERLETHVSRLEELITRGVLGDVVPTGRLVDLVMDEADAATAELSEHERMLQFHSRVLAKLVDDGLARKTIAALRRADDEAESQEETLALILGTMQIDAWLQKREPPHENVVWDRLLNVSLAEMAFDGTLLARIVRDAQTVEEAEVGKDFARALGTLDGERLAAELALRSRDPVVLARSYAELVRGEALSGSVVRFDSMLHLVRAHHRFGIEHGKDVVRYGPTAEVRRRTVEVFEEAFHADMSADAVMDYGHDLRVLIDHSSADEDEQAAMRLTAFSLEAMPVERNVYLKRQYVTAFAFSRVLNERERPFVTKIWNEPEGTWSLEEYEKLLIAQEFPRRARRVRRYRESLRGFGERATEFLKGMLGTK